MSHLPKRLWDSKKRAVRQGKQQVWEVNGELKLNGGNTWDTADSTKFEVYDKGEEQPQEPYKTYDKEWKPIEPPTPPVPPTPTNLIRASLDFNQMYPTLTFIDANNDSIVALMYIPKWAGMNQPYLANITIGNSLIYTNLNESYFQDGGEFWTAFDTAEIYGGSAQVAIDLGIYDNLFGNVKDPALGTIDNDTQLLLDQFFSNPEGGANALYNHLRVEVVDPYIEWFNLSRYLCFTARENGSCIKLGISRGTPAPVYLEKSFDGSNWSTYEINDEITLNQGEKLYLRNSSTVTQSFSSYDESSEEFNEYIFTILSGSFDSSGDITSLINQNGTDTLPNSYVFSNLFNRCVNLYSCPKLPAVNLTPSCYNAMFYGCKNLVSLPELPAETLPYKCYNAMFSGCRSIRLDTTYDADAGYTHEFRIPTQNAGTIEQSPATRGMFYEIGGMYESGFSDPFPIDTTYYCANGKYQYNQSNYFYIDPATNNITLSSGFDQMVFSRSIDDPDRLDVSYATNERALHKIGNVIYSYFLNDLDFVKNTLIPTVLNYQEETQMRAVLIPQLIDVMHRYGQSVAIDDSGANQDYQELNTILEQDQWLDILQTN